jgi:D-xylulose reductase
MILGHESSGVIAAVGSSVTSLKVGDRVAMEPGVPCRHCKPCKSGKYNLCPEMAFASTPPFDGTLTKFYNLPYDFCFKLPDHVSLEAGALVEPSAVAVHVVKQGQVGPGSNVVIFGAGPIGLLCAGVARNYGARKVVIVDIQEQRLKFAQSWVSGGCDTFIPQRVPAKETADKIKSQFGIDDGADTVIEATGAEPCIQAGILVCRRGGTYVQAGMGRDEITFPIAAACSGELNFKGSFRYGSGDYQLAVDMISQGALDVEKLISEKFKFEEAEKAFGEVKEGRGIKMLIEGVKD